MNVSPVKRPDAAPPPVPKAPLTPPPLPIDHGFDDEVTPVSSGPIGAVSLEPEYGTVASDRLLRTAQNRSSVKRIWVGLAGVLTLIAGGAAWSQLANEEGTLTISAAGAAGKTVSRAKIFVNDALRCEQAPCELSLPAGTHIVRAALTGFAETAPQAVQVRGGQTTVYSFTPLPAPTEPASLPSAQLAVPLASSKSVEELKELAAPRATAGTREADPPEETESPEVLEAAMLPPVIAPEASGKSPPKPTEAIEPGKLSMNSIPSSMIVLDGRPLGKTPRVDVPVDPGVHSVTFVHPKQGRKTVSVKLTPGASRTVSVRF